MAVASPVMYQTTMPPRCPRQPPTSPDSFRGTPSSSPIVFEGSSLQDLPYILAPDSRPASPTSQARIDKLVKHIRDREVQQLYLVCVKLSGPFAAGASTWGIGGGASESWDEEDLILADNEEHALELEKENSERRALRTKTRVDVEPTDSSSSHPKPTSTSRSSTIPSVTLSAPQATSTPLSARKHPSSHPSSSQSTLSFTLSKPGLATGKPKDNPKSASQPTTSANPRRASARFVASTLMEKPPRTRSRVHSSQPTPFNSQFDLDQRSKELSRLLEEDGFEIERGAQQVMNISDDDG